MFLQRELAFFSLLLSLGACGRSQAETDVAPGSRDVITADEIGASNAATAYDAIRKLRGNFLSYRGKTSFNNTSPSEPVVFVDDQAFGPISSLRTIPAVQIESIRLYRAWEAQTKYGNGFMGGVIAIMTKH